MKSGRENKIEREIERKRERTRQRENEKGRSREREREREWDEREKMEQRILYVGNQFGGSVQNVIDLIFLCFGYIMKLYLKVAKY